MGGGRHVVALVGLLAATLLLAGCPRGANPADPTAPSATAGTGAALEFWHTQTQSNETALVELIDAYNAQHPDRPPIKPTYMADYTALYQKIRALAAAGDGSLPALAVAYESMVADYMTANIVRPLDDLMADPEIGLSADDLADILPAYLETNRFPQFANQTLSFPFTKSNLMLYYNQDLLEKCGLTVPVTWDDYLAACRKIKQQTGLTPMANAVDPSTIDGVILSMGGRLISDDQRDALFDSPAALATFELWHTLFDEGLAYQVADKNDLNNDFANGKCAFFIRSSTTRPFLIELIGDKFRWGLAGLPHRAGLEPTTVMFGANICLFRSTPERERWAWEFIKYFISRDVTATWATRTGYLPVRKSAAESPAMIDFFAAAPQNRAAWDVLPTAVPEPNAAGWQSVRDCLSEAETSVAALLAKPAEAVAKLNTCADAALQSAP